MQESQSQNHRKNLTRREEKCRSDKNRQCQKMRVTAVLNNVWQKCTEKKDLSTTIKKIILLPSGNSNWHYQSLRKIHKLIVTLLYVCSKMGILNNPSNTMKLLSD